MAKSEATASLDSNPGADPSATSCARVCPTPPGEDRPIIAHRIDVGLCFERQRGHYHKCHRCLFQGRSADFQVGSVTNGRTPATPELRLGGS